MPVYYLSSRPETIVSLVTTGKLPNSLPDWAKIDYLMCQKSIADCFTDNKTSLHQVFILELELPLTKEKATSFLALDFVNTNSIQRIIVYSLRGSNLLKQLFNNNCPKPIVINPEVFPGSAQPYLKRSLPKLFNELEEKKLDINKTRNGHTSSSQAATKQKHILGDNEVDIKRITTYEKPSHFVIHPNVFPGIFYQQSLNVSLPKLFKDTKNALPGPSSSSQAAIHQQQTINDDKVDIKRITTYEEHLQLLQTAFKEAKKSILITSYSINHETLKNAGLYKLIPLAVKRGVRIYFYHNDKKEIDYRIEKFLEKNDIFLADANTHSKILAVDKHFVAAGSFNWLSTIDSDYEPSEEGSLSIRGEAICNSLIEEFWKHIKYYRSLQFGNLRSIFNYESKAENLSSLTYQVDDKTELEYIPNLEEQCGFLQVCFERAKQRVIICSPFISSEGAYQEDLHFKLIINTISRGVKIYFICKNDSDYLDDFKAFLNKFRSSQIHLIPMENIHLKTIIVDDDTIAEGSFNWLSASRDRESEHHNHEQTISIQGEGAKALIEHFFQSRIGQAVLNCDSEKSAQKTYFPVKRYTA